MHYVLVNQENKKGESYVSGVDRGNFRVDKKYLTMRTTLDVQKEVKK